MSQATPIPVLAAMAITALSISSPHAQNKARLQSALDSLSYVIGRDVGSQLKKFGAELEVQAFSAGVEQELKGAASQIDSMKADSIRQAFAVQVQARMESENQRLSAEQKKLGGDFLARNKKQPGVKTTASGLQYRVIREGKGPLPQPGDSVRILYKGMLVDSTVFDSTQSGEPVVLALERTIPGLSEGIRLMKVGARYRFFVPPELAYGEQGIPPDIPPNAVLIFDVELLGVGADGKVSRLGSRWSRSLIRGVLRR